tara:strand:- start:469 stop:855 length:387 start_codon:yes stop_codon:yes gene_type:complete
MVNRENWKNWVNVQNSLGFPNINKVGLERKDLIMDEGLEANYPTQEDVIEFNKKEDKKKEMVKHPNHYGGEENVYEAIKVIEAWELDFNLGNATKYISRAGKKINKLEDLEKASWYINREINKLKNER